MINIFKYVIKQYLTIIGALGSRIRATLGCCKALSIDQITYPIHSIWKSLWFQ